ncbi:chromosome partitioning protein [Pseudosporangium ferrugineum]|uniref:MinD/ParA family ATP-binding protein n=1 Tax=Pseudosporangium ferrugineum TaxID=439699 RepID=UPI003CCBFD35
MAGQPPSRDSSGRPWAGTPADSVNKAGTGSETEESSAEQSHTADSPWAQPLQRPTTAGTPVTSASAPASRPAAPVSGTAAAPNSGTPGPAPVSGAAAAPGPTPVVGTAATPGLAPTSGPAATSVPGTAGSGTPATPSSGAVVTPASGKAAEPVSGGAEPNSTGAVYRPGPVTPGPRQAPTAQPTPNPAVLPQPGPHQPAPPAPPAPHQAGPHQSTPPGPHQAGPQQAGSQQAAPAQPGPPAAWVANGRQAPPVPGPYPPAVAPPNQGQQPGPNPPPVDPYQQLPWVSDGTPTAEEFARRRLAKPAEPVATMGARAMLQKGTMGLVRLAPGKREQEYKQDVEMVRRNFGGLRQVTVVNPKGGAGKTVAVLLLAMTFGQKRGGYVLAWDNNETQGTLGMRAQQDFHARTVRDMMRDLHLFRGSHGRVGDLSQYVRAQGEGMFDVLASDESATAGEMLTASAFAEIREIVSRFYKLIFVDTGNNVRAQNWQAAMDATDQLVITMSARNDSAETAARMLDHLEQSGRQRLVRQAVSVVTMPPTRKDIDLPAIQRHFAARTRAVLLAPYEKLIDSGEPLRYGHLSNGTRDSWLKIAAAVAEGL